MVMDGASLKFRQDTPCFHPFLPPLAMHVIMGQLKRAGHMQPVQLTFHPQTALVKLAYIGSNQLLFDAVSARFGFGLQHVIGRNDNGFRW